MSDPDDTPAAARRAAQLAFPVEHRDGAWLLTTSEGCVISRHVTRRSAMIAAGRRRREYVASVLELERERRLRGALADLAAALRARGQGQRPSRGALAPNALELGPGRHHGRRDGRADRRGARCGGGDAVSRRALPGGREGD